VNPVSQFTAQLHAATVKVPQTVHVHHVEAEESEQTATPIVQVTPLEKARFDIAVFIQKGRQKSLAQLQIKECALFSVLCS
jgi:hypothetical protein